ncbi:EscU/YscU/HrcU family type III secretion system export apparatus switch protein [Rhodobaculum claviforme]|uniref:Flagellar biosynthesis protein FlhB n=1 Tax=Rhodobaculum claviforme TaxID=1549854 RepID=A0A934WKH3_9RHOB|nr:flagellar type III secretion system protein FlhB [Rhodobaculum claviforme]MBK5928558.1 flagellar biosynthesis protein FlhB [Rhodobaculum claviforme]
MSGPQEDGAEKVHEPTQRKLDEARRKGEVPKSNDLVTAAAYAGMALAGFAAGAAGLVAAGDAGMVLFDQADRLSQLTSEGARPVIGGLMVHVGWALAPFLVVPAVAALAMLFAQQALVFAPEKLQPKLSRISPLSNAKQKFGRSGLFEFAKSTAKLLIIGTLLWLFLLARLPRILATMHLGPGLASVEMMRLLLEFLVLVVVILVGIGALDFFWQRAEHLRKQRMTHKEMRDEMKSSEGDPYMKQARRQRGHDIATNRMLTEVPKADVVIVNPTHYAVALKWDRAAGGAPVCVAKGVDEVALRIRTLAAGAGVPIHSDPPTARALHATVALKEEIAPEHYRAVAAAIRFAERMRTRAARGGGAV